MTDLSYWIDLGRRMRLCKGFSWRGLRHFNGQVSDEAWFHDEVPSSWVPDLRDPGTLGYARAMTREAWGCSGLHTRPHATQDGFAWSVCVWEADAMVMHKGEGTTEAEAIIAAWEALDND